MINLQPGHEFLGTPYSPYAAVKVGLMKQQNKHTTNNHTTNNHTTTNEQTQQQTNKPWHPLKSLFIITLYVPSVQALNIVHLKHLGRY